MLACRIYGLGCVLERPNLKALHSSTPAAIPELSVLLVWQHRTLVVFWTEQLLLQMGLCPPVPPSAEPPSCAGEMEGSWAFMAELFIGISAKDDSKEAVLIWLGLFWILTNLTGRRQPWPLSQTQILKSFPQLPACLLLSPERPIQPAVNRQNSSCILGVKNK